MPRPPDTYTHSQFTPIESNGKADTVQCNHCKTWTGNIKTLNRKKEHLLQCPSYLQWRASGNGQDLAPPNSYNANKRDSSGQNIGEDGHDGSPYTGRNAGQGLQHCTPAMTKSRSDDISKAFDEFWDDSATQKCMRVRCRHCGFVRAKNTTRQVEHLSTCREFLTSAEGQQVVNSGGLMLSETEGSDIWRGGAPNPNLAGMINRRGPNSKPRASGGGGGGAQQMPSRTAPRPSLASHLISRMGTTLTDATQRSFLSHAGCGTLSAAALNQWLAQEIHISRALVPFVGQLIGKTRIPETSDLTHDPTYRALDLLCSAVNNMKKELEFLEATKRKYNLNVDIEDPHAATQGFMDLFASASSPQSSLLEGLVVLWATEHCFCTSFQYAANFTSTMPASSNYQLPSYLTPGTTGGGNMYGDPSPSSDSQHVSALHEAFIQNWTSANFVRFVSACKSIVDEVANSQTTGNGKTEMVATERRFRQAVTLWGQIWPEVDGMGEEEAVADDGAQNGGSADADADGNGDRPIDIDDEVDADGVDSPYGGLAAVAAHNRVSS